MSLTKRHLAPVFDLIDGARLPNITQLVVIKNVEIKGHTYQGSTINTTGNARTHFGDFSTMAHHQRLLSRELTHDLINTPPASEAEKIDLPEGSLQSSTHDDAPPEYRDREYDWFIPGRLFRIYAPRDVEIHEKEFVLLDTKNKEGPGLLIRSYDEEEERELTRGYGLRAHILVQSYKTPDERPIHSRKKVVYLDEYDDEDVDDHTWIELEHTYNIPFAKYKCVDCGVLERSSLQDLRRGYLDWLHYHWSLN